MVPSRLHLFRVIEFEDADQNLAIVVQRRNLTRRSIHFETVPVRLFDRVGNFGGKLPAIAPLAAQNEIGVIVRSIRVFALRNEMVNCPDVRRSPLLPFQAVDASKQEFIIEPGAKVLIVLVSSRAMKSVGSSRRIAVRVGIEIHSCHLPSRLRRSTVRWISSGWEGCCKSISSILASASVSNR